MALEVIGRLHTKFPTQNIKENFSKREFVIELTEETQTGMVYTNYASFQLVNNSCAVIDNFQEGDMLKVSFNIRGNRWERDGQVKYITNLNAWRVERAAAAQGAQPNYAQPQQQYAAPQSQQAFSQPQQAPAPQSFPPQSESSQDDGLPF